MAYKEFLSSFMNNICFIIILIISIISISTKNIIKNYFFLLILTLMYKK